MIYNATISNNRELHWWYMYHTDCNLRPENIYVSEIKYQKYQQNIEENSSFRTWKCKIFQARSLHARSHIHRFSQCQCFVGTTVVCIYNAIPITGNCIDDICIMQIVIWDLKLYVYEIKYQKYQQNIEGNNHFRMWKCKNFPSSLAPRSFAYSQIFSMLVFCQILSFIPPYHK